MFGRLWSKLWSNRLARLITIILLVAVVTVIWQGASDDKHEPQQTNISQIRLVILNKQVQRATIYEKERLVRIQTKDGREFEARFADRSSDKLQQTLFDNNVGSVTIKEDNEGAAGGLSSIFLKYILPFIPLLLIFLLFTAVSSGKGLSILGGTSAQRYETPKVRFSDVKGADEPIEDLREVVRSLQPATSASYADLEFERGIILYGPTGTGKTTLAMAVAGEAGVPFFRLGGAQLHSRWAGGTSNNIGSYFESIRKQMKDRSQPFVCFIDEIDGVATKRVGEERADRDTNTSVTQFLEQVGRMLAEYPHAVIIAATNRLETLDDAVKRPGRLGRHIAMPNPDLVARRAILHDNSAKYVVSEEDLESAASLTAGQSGATVSRIPHEAAILARKEREDNAAGKITITRRHIELAAMAIVMGTLRYKRQVHPEDEKIAIIHESGHATVAAASPYHRLLIATSIPIGQSGGSTWFTGSDRGIVTQSMIRWQLDIAMGGRAAEMLEGEASSGPGHDIQSATELILEAICHYGMFGFPVLNIPTNQWMQHPLKQRIAETIEQEIEAAQKRAEATLRKQQALRESIVAALTEKRILFSDETAALREQTFVADQVA